MTSIQLGGWAKFSSCDFPGRLVSTVFAQGCPWECLYCHNPALISPQESGSVEWLTVLDFMHSRKNLLDGFVFSGGEPTRQEALIDAARDIKELGFDVGVHTSGVYPARVRSLLSEGLVDWFGLDIKTSFERYSSVVQTQVNPAKILDSLEAILAAGVDLEVRTTIHQSYLSEEDVDSIVRLLSSHGVPQWVVQRVRSEGSVREWQQVNDSLVEYCVSAGELAGVSVVVR